MKIQLLVEVEAPNVARNASEVQADLRQLLMDTLQLNPNFPLRAAVTEATDKSSALLTTSDLSIQLRASERTIRRWMQAEKIPAPIRVAKSHASKGAPRWFREDIAAMAAARAL